MGINLPIRGNIAMLAQWMTYGAVALERGLTMAEVEVLARSWPKHFTHYVTFVLVPPIDQRRDAE